MNSNFGQQSSNPIQQRVPNYGDSRFSTLSDQHNSQQSTTQFPHIEVKSTFFFLLQIENLFDLKLGFTFATCHTIKWK